MMPFVDLKAQMDRIDTAVKARMDAVLAHGRFILGPEVAELEAALAVRAQCDHVIGVSSGTDAILAAMMAAGVGAGDAVFLPAFTFTATPEAALMCGATPVFVDVDPNTYNIDPDDLARRVGAVMAAGELTPRVVLAVDLFGMPAPYEPLKNICADNGMLLIADAAQSFGARQGDTPVGALAPVTATSFFPAKPLGCFGDGGAVFTDDAALATVIRSIRAHGKGAAKYDIVRIGLNARLDTLQAAVLLAKLEIFDEELAARERVASWYDEALATVVQCPLRTNKDQSAWAQYTIQCDDRDGLAGYLKQQGVPTAIYYPLPMHQQTAYAGYLQEGDRLPHAERLCQRVLSLPMHPYLTEDQAGRITAAIVDYYQAGA